MLREGFPVNAAANLRDAAWRRRPLGKRRRRSLQRKLLVASMAAPRPGDAGTQQLPLPEASTLGDAWDLLCITRLAQWHREGRFDFFDKPRPGVDDKARPGFVSRS